MHLYVLHSIQVIHSVASICVKGNITIVIIQSGIVNGYQLICDAHTVPEAHRGTAAFFYFTNYPLFPLFLFMCLSL